MSTLEENNASFFFIVFFYFEVQYGTAKCLVFSEAAKRICPTQNPVGGVLRVAKLVLARLSKFSVRVCRLSIPLRARCDAAYF